MIKEEAMPLSGVRVLEIGQIAAGPFAGSLLADLGADVVKVERPGSGDGLRDWPPFKENSEGEAFSENFASLNRNKRSILIDFKKTDDIARLKNLVAVCDVVLENFRPGVLSKLALGYQDLSVINPKLVYCSISGFGQTGPKSKKGAFDVTVQGFSGLMSVTGTQGGEPIKSGVPVGDFCAGLYAGYTILARLIQARETGCGAHIDCSMLGGLLGVSALQTSEYFGTGVAPQALGSAHPRNAPYQAFKASDNYFVVAAGNDRLWHEVIEVTGLIKLKQDSRFTDQVLRAKNQQVLAKILQKEFEKRKATYWLQELDLRGVPCAEINSYPEVLQSEQIRHMGLVRNLKLPNGTETQTLAFPISMTDFKFNIYRSPPKLGEHNDQVDREWLTTKESRGIG